MNGHRNVARMKLTNLFDFCVFQVRYGHSKRSDDLFLVVFPCPQLFSENVHECMSVIKGLLSGDVEINPGPPTTGNNSQTQPADREETRGNTDSEPVMAMLRDLKARSSKIEEGQLRILNSIQSLSITQAK